MHYLHLSFAFTFAAALTPPSSAATMTVKRTVISTLLPMCHGLQLFSWLKTKRGEKLITRIVTNLGLTQRSGAVVQTK